MQNRDYFSSAIADIGEKLEQAETQLSHGGRLGSFFAPEKKKEESQLTKLTKDTTKTTIEQVHGLISQVMKDICFNLKKSDSN